MSALCETARSQKVAVNCLADLMLTQSPVCTSVVRKLLPLALVPPAQYWWMIQGWLGHASQL